MTLLYAKTLNERLYPPPIGRFTLFQNRIDFYRISVPADDITALQGGSACDRGKECKGSTRAIRAAERLPAGISPAASLSCVNPSAGVVLCPRYGSVCLT